MKVYKVKVNGKVYEVELESAKEVEGSIAVAQPTAPQAPTAPVTPGKGEELKAPMAGTILEVKVSVGQTVKAGDVVCILEAMKLENEVVAPTAGTITEVAVSKGTAVQNGQLLVKIG